MVKKGGDGGLIEKIAEPRARQEDLRDQRPARRDRPLRHAARDRAEARRDSGGRAQQALQAHLAAADVRRQHGRARGRRAAHARPARGDPLLRPPPEGGRHPAHQGRAASAPSAARTSSRAC